MKFRLTCVVVVLVLAATLLVGLSSMSLAERDMKTVVGEQQLAVLSSAAAFIDDRLDAKKRLMRALADNLPAADRASPARIQAYLEANAGLRSEFLNLAALGADGKLLASLLPMPGLNAAGMQYLEATMAARQGIVSAPFRSRISGMPVVLVTAPVLDADGKVVLVLSAGVALHDSAFLRQLDHLKPGKSGFLFIMTADGVLIDHPDKQRELQHINGRPGLNRATERALAGFEGTMEAANKDGEPCIYTYKRLSSADWIIGARYPVDEAFAPLIALRKQALAAALLVALAAGGLAWLLIYRMLAPLEALRRNVSAIRLQGADIAVLHSGRHDEIGELGTAFHELMAAHEADRERIRDSERRIHVITDNMPALIGYINAEERYEFANAKYQTHLGVAPAQVIGRTVREVLGEARYAKIAPRMHAALAGQRQHFDQQFEARSDGRSRHYMIDYIPEVKADGRTDGVYVLARDISERRAAEMEKENSERRLRLITDHLPVLICYIDRSHNFRFGNATFETWLGVAPASLPGRPLAEVLGADLYATARLHLENAFGGWAVSFESRMAVGGKLRILETTYVPDVQADGSVAGVYALTHDMTRLKETEEKLTRLARIDSLTGIANRRKFVEALHQSIERSRRHGTRLALAYLDIDLFKKINDSHGHGVGDDVLKEFARRLQANVRAGDTVARLSGDEFVIIIDDLKHDGDARILAEKIAAAIRKPFHVGTMQLAITTSVGIASFAGGDETHEQLLANADHALYQAKRNGRDGVSVFDELAPAA